MPTHSHSFAHWPFDAPVNTAAFCTAAVAERRLPVLQVAHDHNGDWQFLDATTDDPGEPVMLCLGCVFEHDPSLAGIADLPAGWAAWRPEPGAEWERWEKDEEEDDEEEDDEDEDDGCCHDEEAAERKALADIEQYGLHVLHVRGAGERPPFSYSIGIKQSLGMPELIVVGLKPEVAHAAINECYRQMKQEGGIASGARVKGLLGGDFACLVAEVSPAHYRDYMVWARWLNDGDDFRAWQIIYPNTANVFPWEPQADDWFRSWQPILADKPVTGA